MTIAPETPRTVSLHWGAGYGLLPLRHATDGHLARVSTACLAKRSRVRRRPQNRACQIRVPEVKLRARRGAMLKCRRLAYCAEKRAVLIMAGRDFAERRRQSGARQAARRERDTWQDRALPGAISCSSRPSGRRLSRRARSAASAGPGRAREGTEHPLLGGLQFGAGARSVPQRARRDGQGGVAHQRSDHDQPASRRRDERLGPDQRQQSLGAQGHVPGGADQAARPGALRALLRKDDAGLQAAVSMGDERRRQGAARHGQRFGPYSFVVNTDKVSRATAEDQGWDLWNDPANAGKYGILESDDWNVFNICLIAGFDPFREHTDEEVAKFAETAKTRVQGRQARRRHRHHEPGLRRRRDRLPHDRRHLFRLAGARRRLPEHPRHHAEEGADGRRQGRRRRGSR